jgi:hypothetical protein
VSYYLFLVGTDFEDHTFCGVMFPIQAKQDLPINQLVIRSVAVRGYLGPISVHVSKDSNSHSSSNHSSNGEQARPAPTLLDYQHRSAEHWTKVYEQTHEPSRRVYKSLVLDPPIVLRPGQTRILYIHSTAPHDRAIVYDNSQFTAVSRARYDDSFLQIHTGLAHLSPTVFGQTPIWGWGSAWRTHREFVGQVEYGVVYQLWHPERHNRFGQHFDAATRALLLCQRRDESPFAQLPDECIFYILNMCRWDWFDDQAQDMTYWRRMLGGGTGDSRRRLRAARDRRPRFRFGLGTLRNKLTHISTTGNPVA